MMRHLFLLMLSLMFSKKIMLSKILIMCVMIIIYSIICYDKHNVILKRIFMPVLSSFYKIIVHAINLVLLILSMSIILSVRMNFGLYVYSIIITKTFIDHQIMAKSEVL